MTIIATAPENTNTPTEAKITKAAGVLASLLGLTGREDSIADCLRVVYVPCLRNNTKWMAEVVTEGLDRDSLDMDQIAIELAGARWCLYEKV